MWKMFSGRRKSENKAKLEHKLYLARVNPEPIFDLSDCDLKNVPAGIFSLCKVFLKEILKLDNNLLSSLSGGGQLVDLSLLRILDLHSNEFIHLTDEIQQLKNLQELYLNNNKLKHLPNSLCHLRCLKILDVSHNNLKELPEDIGNLKSLTYLNIKNNVKLKKLPISICKATRLVNLELDFEDFVYPPIEIAQEGVANIMTFICQDNGLEYSNVENMDSPNINEREVDSTTPFKHDHLNAKIMELENLKLKKMQDFLNIERYNEDMTRQEFEMANAQKVNRERLLADISQQQTFLDSKINKLQELRDVEHFKLIEQLQEAEQNAFCQIKQLLLMKNEPLTHILEQENEEKLKLIELAMKNTENLDKLSILNAMQNALNLETEQFQQWHQRRIEVSKSILQQELETDTNLEQILLNQDKYKSDLVARLVEDVELQKAMVGNLLEKSDARCWGLTQQVALVEKQLMGLTQLEMDRKKLLADQQMNDLAQQRIELSILLLDLLNQQEIRRAQLLITIQELEKVNETSDSDFWIKQYQKLMERLPTDILEAQKNMDPILLESLLSNGVIHCLPYLAKFSLASESIVEEINENTLRVAGIQNTKDLENVLKAFRSYNKLREVEKIVPTAPELTEASAPMQESSRVDLSSSECAVCMDSLCEVVFLPCGHICCCIQCSTTLVECPLCRGAIERKIKLILSS